MADTLLTVEQVSDWLAVKERTILSLVARGELPGVRIGKQWRFDRAQVQDYINRQSNQDQQKGEWK